MIGRVHLGQDGMQNMTLVHPACFNDADEVTTLIQGSRNMEVPYDVLVKITVSTVAEAPKYLDEQPDKPDELQISFRVL